MYILIGIVELLSRVGLNVSEKLRVYIAEYCQHYKEKIPSRDAGLIYICESLRL